MSILNAEIAEMPYTLQTDIFCFSVNFLTYGKIETCLIYYRFEFIMCHFYSFGRIRPQMPPKVTGGISLPNLRATVKYLDRQASCDILQSLFQDLRLNLFSL